jgi:hypothetical protein
MGNITITKRDGFFNVRLRRLFWFVALWGVGVAGAMLLALPFRLLIRFGAGI